MPGKSNTKEFIEKAKLKYGNKFSFEKTVYTGAKKPIIVTCKFHGDLNTHPQEFLREKSLHGCKYCAAKANKENTLSARLLLFKQKLKERHGDKYVIVDSTFKGILHPVDYYCYKHGLLSRDSAWGLIYPIVKHPCRQCAFESLTKDTDWFIEKAKSIHGDKYDYSESTYTGSDDKIKIICPIHGPFWQRAGSHVSQGKRKKGCGCPKCYIIDNYNHDFVEQAKKVHCYKYDYSRVVYTGNKKEVEVICPEHGVFRVKPNRHLVSKQGCPDCRESFGELNVRYLLEKHGISYIQEYRIKGYRYRFDFYLPDLNLFIEFHGEIHYKPILGSFGGEKAFHDRKARDLRKRNLVYNKGSSLITLNYLDLKEGRLEQKLIREITKRTRFYYLDENNTLFRFRSWKELTSKFYVSEDLEWKYLEKYLADKYKLKKFCIAWKVS